MHAVRVGVAGMEVGECGVVGVGVLRGTGMVAVIGFVGVNWAVLFTNVTADSCVLVLMGVILGCGRATDPQDVKRISPTQRTI